MMRGLWILFFLVLMGSTQAQERFKKHIGIGGSVGASNYTGDLDDSFNLKFVRPGFGLHMLYCFHPHFSLRFTYYQASITADDAKGSSTKQDRNLSFESPISEFGLNLLYYPFAKPYGALDRKIVSPYIFTGLTMFRFNPQAEYNGQLIELQPLGTEGQYLGGAYPAPYSLTELSVPMGIGVFFKVSRHVDIQLESGFRKTFTDYLDDVSGKYPDLGALNEVNPVAAALSNRSTVPVLSGNPRGNPGNNDGYFYTNIGFVYYFYSSSKRWSSSIVENCFRFEE